MSIVTAIWRHCYRVTVCEPCEAGRGEPCTPGPGPCEERRKAFLAQVGGVEGLRQLVQDAVPHIHIKRRTSW